MLGCAFGVSCGVVGFVEKLFNSKVITFLLDFVMLAIWGFSFFSMLIAYNGGSFRANFGLSCAGGFLVYYNTLHRLLLPLTNKLVSLSNRLNSFVLSKYEQTKKALQKHIK